MSEATKAAPGYLFQLTCDCGNGKNIVVSFNPNFDDDLAALNARVDLVNAIFDRQRAKHEAPLLEEKIEGTKQQIEAFEAELEAYVATHAEPSRAGQKGPKILDQGLVDNLKLKIKHAQVALARGEITYMETLERAK